MSRQHNELSHKTQVFCFDRLLFILWCQLRKVDCVASALPNRAVATNPSRLITDYGNILKGEGSVFDVLNLIPALQVSRAFKRSRTVSSAIVETDTALTQVAKKTECFVAGTEIQTLDGTKNIEDIPVGDWVLSDDPNTVGEIEYKQVLQTFVKETSNLVDIYIDGEKITTTEEHPFWVPDLGWVAAKDLHAGSLLQTKTESWLDVDKVEKHSGLATVYNFEVQGFHTYFVSDLGLLVHNNCTVSASDLTNAYPHDVELVPLWRAVQTAELKSIQSNSRYTNLRPRWLSPLNSVKCSCRYILHFS